MRAELGEGPHFAGDDVVATVTASYYAGGGLPDAPVTWTVEQRSTSFTPPNRGDYHFGPAPRWWWPWFDREEEVDVQRCQVESRRDPKPVRCRFPTELGGRYQVTAVVTDGQGRRNESALRTWVLGGSAPTERSLEADRVMVIPDEKEYRPGDKATVLVVAPFTPAEGVFTVRRQGVVHLERISLTEPSQTLEVELDDSMVPNVEFAVELVGAAPREGADGEPDPSLPLRPARASGSAKVKVLPSTRTLAVQATPKVARLPPGGSTTLDIEVRDPDGRPVRAAEVAVMVVDEAVLALSNYRTPDPLAAFYRDRPSGVRALGNRENVLLIRSGMEPDEWDLGRRGGGGGLGIGGLGTRGGAGLLAGSKASDADETWGGGLGAGLRQAFAGLGGDEDHPIHAREDFTSLALFAPRLRTDAEGRASVSVKLPDNLTRYRVMAVAAAGDRLFGSTESTITARLPLMVRPSAPRFLNLGDAFELSVLIQNQTDEPVEATVVARATNLELQNGARRVTVLANDRVEVRFPAKTLRAGTARFQFGVAAPGFADASQLELPVYTPATTEAFATYGELDDGAIAQPVRLPDAVFTQFGGLEVTTSSTQLQALTDAVLYLASYPFDCTEQLASRVMSLAALRDVLSAFRAEGLPSPEVLEAQMRGDLERLEQMQREDGGWSFWEGQQGTWPYVTVHAAHALVRAMEKGYEPNHRTLARATTYLRRIHEQIPDWYGDDAKRSIEAYALYVLWRNDDVEPEGAVRLIERAGGVEKLPLEALGWIWPILSSSRHELVVGDERHRYPAARAGQGRSRSPVLPDRHAVRPQGPERAAHRSRFRRRSHLRGGRPA